MMERSIFLIFMLIGISFAVTEGTSVQIKAVPVVKGTAPSFIIENENAKCEDGHYCPISSGVCCKGGKVCCEAACNDATDPPTCDATAQQKSLAIARAAMQNEAQTQVDHEKNLKAKEERGQKATAEVNEKKKQEEKEKEQRATQEANNKATKTAEEEKNKKDKESQEDQEKSQAKKKLQDTHKKKAADEAKSKSKVFINSNTVLARGKLLKKNSEVPNTGEFTYLFWIFPRGKRNGWSNIFQKGSEQSARSPGCFFYPKSTRLSCRSDVKGKKNFGKDYTGQLPIAKWTHVGFVHKKGSFEIWINGVKKIGIKSPELEQNEGHLYAASPFAENADAFVSDFRYFMGAQGGAKIVEIMKKKKYVPVELKYKTVFSTHDHTKAGRKAAQSTSLQWGGQYTYTFWIRALGQSLHWSNVLHKGSKNTERNPAVWFYPRSTRLHIRSGVAGSWNFGTDPPNALGIDQWTHVAIVHSKKKLTVYYNAKKVASVNAKPPLKNAGPLYISDPWHRESPCMITDVRYSHHALKVSDIVRILYQKKYSSGLPPLQKFMFKLKFKPSQNRMLVSSGQRASWAWTYTLWIKPSGTSRHWTQIFHKGNSNYHRNPAMWFYPHRTRLHIRHGSRRSWNDGNDPGAQLTRHQWTHVAITSYEGLSCVYYNGKKVSCSGSGLEPVWRNEPMRGCSPWYYGSPCEVSDFRYYDVPLHTKYVNMIMKENKK